MIIHSKFRLVQMTLRFFSYFSQSDYMTRSGPEPRSTAQDVSTLTTTTPMPLKGIQGNLKKCPL